MYQVYLCLPTGTVINRHIVYIHGYIMYVDLQTGTVSYLRHVLIDCLNTAISVITATHLFKPMEYV